MEKSKENLPEKATDEIETRAELLQNGGEKKIADATLRLREMDGGVDDGLTSDERKSLSELARESSADFLRVRPDYIEHWFDNRITANRDFLRRKSPHLAQVYENLINDREMRFRGLQSIGFRQLSRSEIAEYGEANALFSTASSTEEPDRYGHMTPRVAPMVKFNFDNPQAYTERHAKFRDHLEGISANLAQIALRAGAKPSDVLDNPKLMQTFVFMHELGHAEDFMTNFLVPEMNKRQSGSKRQALPDVCERFWKRSRVERLSMTVAAGGKEAREELFYGRFADKDARTTAEMKFLHSVSYRHQKQEWHADSFAAQYIWRHYDDYFCDKNDRKGLAEGKVPTRIGEYMRMSPESMVALEYFASSRVSIQQLDKNGKPVRGATEYYLEAALRPGENLRFSTSGDPLSRDPDSHMMTRSKIKEVGIVPTRVEGRIEPITYLTAENGDRYVMRHVRDPKTGEYVDAPEIDETAVVASRRLGLATGSVMRIMKREKEGDSAVLEGVILSGRLKHPFMDKIPVDLDNNMDGLNYGNTSPVTRVYRKWKTYYFETSGGPKAGGSVYEILRGKNDKRP